MDYDYTRIINRRNREWGKRLSDFYAADYQRKWLIDLSGPWSFNYNKFSIFTFISLVGFAGKHIVVEVVLGSADEFRLFTNTRSISFNTLVDHSFFVKSLSKFISGFDVVLLFCHNKKLINIAQVKNLLFLLVHSLLQLKVPHLIELPFLFWQIRFFGYKCHELRIIPFLTFLWRLFFLLHQDWALGCLGFYM